MRPTWEERWSSASQTTHLDLEKVQKKLKSFGTLSPAEALPSPQTLKSERTYKLYVGGKQTRPDTQSSRPICLPESNEIYCLIADASRKDVRNAVEAANAALNGFARV
jgi:aldehyde dehydrogenase (NAD+)